MSKLTYRAVVECLHCELHDEYTDWDNETKTWCNKFNRDVPSHGFCMWGLQQTTYKIEEVENE